MSYKFNQGFRRIAGMALGMIGGVGFALLAASIPAGAATAQATAAGGPASATPGLDLTPLLILGCSLLLSGLLLRGAVSAPRRRRMPPPTS
jgi:hypothetical protein